MWFIRLLESGRIVCVILAVDKGTPWATAPDSTLFQLLMAALGGKRGPAPEDADGLVLVRHIKVGKK